MITEHQQQVAESMSRLLAPYGVKVEVTEADVIQSAIWTAQVLLDHGLIAEAKKTLREAVKE